MARKSINLKLNKISSRDVFIIAGAVVLIAVIYLITSWITYSIGFPLDDSWIHQTYARNLALRGEWAFRPGIPSAGSTAPLWSALLALGFLLRLSPYIWTFFLGIVSLFALAVVSEWAVRELIHSYRPRFPWIGFFFAFEWHMAWAAMSGMETLLHGLIVTTVLVLLMTNTHRYLTLGLLTGLAAWVRPDGLTLLGPVLMTILFTQKDTHSRLTAITRYLIGFGSLFVPYLLFNLAIGGTPMPNTFYAKQAEYASWQTIPIFTRLGQMFLQLLVGPSLVLIPGVIGWLIKSIREKLWGSLAAIIWCAGYLSLYISRLPVYQHGRYIMPAMPIFFLFGLLAFAEFDKGKLFDRFHWIGQTIWRSSSVMLIAAFIFLGAQSYANDVAVIESEMVVIAKWVAANLPPDALIAAHDIGALGYFDYHNLIDLAGLISPDVIPFIRDEPQLANYLDQNGADYLIAFPEFYPLMTGNAETVFVTNSAITLAFDQKNMVVYLWKTP
ncbi:MAG: hypothetical protein IPL71_14675 [Anaerolineales bacterium]|uniref:hypothetical protein n=1 Tax=Candidatus Villigracilis proximus TaxID=3140683 RepID=UPI0031349E9A|nr:hypothetical protein [Anaerolineales bacterium]